MTEIELREGLINVTKEGRVQDWTERMAYIVQKIDVPTHYICWQGSPYVVATNIIKQVKNNGKLQDLESIITIIQIAVN